MGCFILFRIVTANTCTCGWSCTGASGEPDFTHMVSIDGTQDIPAYYIDRYEYPNEEGMLPVAGISLEEAEELCAKQEKRLCTSAEWRQACLGVMRCGMGMVPLQCSELAISRPLKRQPIHPCCQQSNLWPPVLSRL